MPDHDVQPNEPVLCHPEAGAIDVRYAGQTILRGATAEVSYRGPDGALRHLSLSAAACTLRTTSEENVLAASDGQIALFWHIRPGPPSLLQLEIENHSQSDLQLERLTVLKAPAGGLDLGTPASAWRFYQNGWQSWSPAFVRPLAGGAIHSEPDNDDFRRKHLPHGPLGDDLSSDTFTVIHGGRGGLSLALGFITTAQNVNEVRLTRSAGASPEVRAVCHGDGVLLPAGGRYRSERLLLLPGPDPAALLAGFLDRLGETMQARVAEHIPTGWCSWYYFFGENTEADVLAGVARAKAEALPMQYFVLDDGYETAIGDWTSFDPKYPRGLLPMFQEMREAGYKPGLWLAPFGIDPTSRLYADHPDWVLRDEAGLPVEAWHHQWREASMLALDCTHPGVKQWLYDLFRLMSHDWGVDYFKIDFCFVGALPGRRYDRTVTRAGALRGALEIIRRAVGDSFLLGCGMPLGPAVGLVDGMRISTDVFLTWRPFWPDPSGVSTRNALMNSITRSAMHRRLWLNDPDCAILRRRADENDLRLNETRTLMAVMALSGGLLLDGDNLATLTADRLRYLTRLLPPLGTAAQALDLFEHEMPRLLALPVTGPGGPGQVIAAINWEDRSVRTVLDLARLLGDNEAPHHVYDLLNERYLGQAQGELVIERHEPHATSLLLLKPVSAQPELLASTFHLLGGMAEVRDVSRTGTSLRVEVEKEGRTAGSLVFVFPDGRRPLRVRVNGRARRRRTLPGGLLSVGLTLEGRATVEVEYEHTAGL